MSCTSKSTGPRIIMCVLLVNWLATKTNSLQDITENQQMTPAFHLYSNEFSTHGNNKNVHVQKSPRILADDKNKIHSDLEASLLQLSKYLIDLHYQPTAILVDDTYESHYDASYFTNKFLSNPSVRTEFWLMNFNTSGVSSVIAESRLNSKEFKDQLAEDLNMKRLKDSHALLAGSTSFFAVLKATQILPEKSGILLFASRKSLDEDLSQLTVNNLAKKRIKLFVVWSGTYPTSGNEEQILKEVAKLSGGDIFLGNKKSSNENNSSQISGVTSIQEVMFIKNTFKDELIFLPIDHTVKKINIVIEGTFASANLQLPKGNIVDLATGSATSDAHDSSSDRRRRIGAQFDTTTDVGVWKLRVDAQESTPKPLYNVTIFAETDLTVLPDFGNQDIWSPVKKPDKKEIYLRINGDVSNVENVTLLDVTGRELQNVPYTVSKKTSDFASTFQTGNKSVHGQQIKISNSNVTLPTESFYIKVTGTNNKGEHFSRLSYLSRNIDNRDPPLIAIEVNPTSTLLVTAGSRAKVIFEVTNNLNQPVFLIFTCQDEQRLLYDLSPRSAWVNPKQTITVTLYTVQVPRQTFTDMITLMVQGQEKGQKSVLLYASNVPITDNDLPRLDYRFTSSCREVSSSSCQSGTWTIEVTAQDSQTGLLSLTSNPPGLYVPNNFVSGTKETVTAYYSATCCQPLLEITAIDLNNNKRSYKVDANQAQLSTGSIVAIVLGALLFLVLVIIAVILIRRRCKQRESLDLPRYRSQAGTSRF